MAQRARRVHPESNADDSSFLFDASYFRPATIFEGDSSRSFAAVLVRVCARWPTQRRRRRASSSGNVVPAGKPIRWKLIASTSPVRQEKFGFETIKYNFASFDLLSYPKHHSSTELSVSKVFSHF